MPLLRDKFGRFKKGNIGFWKNKKRSFKTNRKISKTLLGKYSGIKHPRWNGGKYKRKDGYIVIYSPNHPKIKKNPYILEHILVMEKYLGRYLKPEERVHHINNKRADNRIENLRLFSTNSEHCIFHQNIPKISKDFLFKEYIFNKKSINDISKIIKISSWTIRDRLIKFNIPLRDRTTAIKIKKIKCLNI